MEPIEERLAREQEERERKQRLRSVAARNREAQNLYSQKQKEIAFANRQLTQQQKEEYELQQRQRQKSERKQRQRQRKAKHREAKQITRQIKAQQREQEEIARQRREEEIEKQRKEIARKERERQETDHKINKLIDEKKLYRFDAITIEDKNKYKHQQKPKQHQKDDILYNKHRHILKEWNQNSTKLETIAMSSKNMKSFIQQNINDIDDDEKNINNEQGFGDKLFNSYFECHSIINQQSIRLCQSTTNDYLLQLISRQNALSKSVKEQELNTLSTAQKYDDQNEQYQTLKQQRTALQNKIELEFKKCNEMIREENQLFQQLQRMKRFKTESETEMNALKASSKSCVSVIKLYNDFMESNKQNIDKSNANFAKIWSEFESKWMQWTVKDMVGWFKYKTIKMNADKIDWMKTENQLVARNITGKSLVNFNNLVFELIGIQDFDIVTHLSAAITILKKKYAMNDIDKQSKSDKKGHGAVPAEFLCPITKQIMRDPVIAFDGHCYDRNAIESYLKIHKKSPKTGSTADYVIVFPNHKLKADIQKYIAINNMDLEQQNEGCNEGVSETAYM